MALLYVVGGIGVGLFFMMRRRYVLWRHAAFWGVTVGLLQTLAARQRIPPPVDDLRHGDSTLDVLSRSN